MVRLLAFLASISLFQVLSAQAQSSDRRPLTAVDMIEVQRLSAANLSPNGNFLLYKKSNTNWAENEIVRRFELLDLSTGEQRATPNPDSETKSARESYWRPDSEAILYLKRTGDDDLVQVFEFNLQTEESQQLTNHHTSVIDVYFGADSDHFFFTATQKEQPDGALSVSEDWIINAYDTPLNREVWRFDMAPRTSVPIIWGDFSIRNVAIHPSGDQLLYFKTPNHLLDVSHRGEVFVRDLASGEDTQWTRNNYRESGPTLSPDGQMLAYIATVNADGEPYFEDKVFVQAMGEEPQRLLADRPMEALEYAWDQAGTGLYILGNTGLRSNLYHYTLSTGVLRQLTEGDHSVSNWTYDPELNTHVARISSPANPGEIYIMTSLETGFEPVTNVYDGWVERFDLPMQEAITWKGRRGVTIEGLLVYPIGYAEGERYPLVTITHGGPRSSSQFGSWNISRYVSVLAGQGYMVLLPNHRGGTGYGDRFMRDMYGRYFRNAHHDVMDGIDALIDRGLADPDRLVKMGWSAGGHMVNKLITHTDRFKAASSGAGAADWLSMHGESDARHNRQWVFGGEPWTRDAPRRQYLRDSPLNDVWKVKTPTLFFVGEEDVRVPPTQSILMYRGVRAAGAPTALYVAEGEPHNYREPVHQLFKINAELAWYAHFALGQTYEGVLPAEAYVEEEEPPSEAHSAD